MTMMPVGSRVIYNEGDFGLVRACSGESFHQIFYSFNGDFFGQVAVPGDDSDDQAIQYALFCYLERCLELEVQQ